MTDMNGQQQQLGVPQPQQQQQQSQQQQQAKSSSSSTSPTSSYTSMIVGSNYKIGRKIGEGSFGIIYEGVNLLTDSPVAIKFESKKSEAPQLRDEYRTYKLLAGSLGVANVYYYGQEGMHNVLVIDLLGLSLEDLFDGCGRKFTIKTTAMVAKQMITRVQMLHEKNLIYRDIKPDNFLVGRGSSKQNMVYIVDFGMAKQYRDPKTKQHIPYRERKSLSGTARYMSINTHLGREQSRRDDMEALGHVFFYFLRGSLPWQGLKAATNKQKYEKIGEKKQQTSVKELCEGYPEEFGVYLSYCRKLGFEETPDYDLLRGLMNKVLQRLNETDDGVYDWMLIDKDKMNQHRLESDKNAYLGGPSGNQKQHISPSNMKLNGSQDMELSKNRANSSTRQAQQSRSPQDGKNGQFLKAIQNNSNSKNPSSNNPNNNRNSNGNHRQSRGWLSRLFCCGC